MIDKLKKHWPIVTFVIIGVIGGYLYWRFVGCNTGTCPITANWHTSSLYGGLIGYFVGDMFKKREKKQVEENAG